MRLLSYINRAQSGWMVLEASSVSHSKAPPYLPVIDLHGYFKITSDDGPRTRREKVNGRIVTLDPALEDTRTYLFGLLALAEGEDPLAQIDAQTRKRRTLVAIKRILLRESLNQPLMVIFEDLHWIDEQTQDFLNLLVESIGTARILLLVNYRPDYSHQWGSKTHYTQLRLDPLGRASAEEMLSALLGDGNELAALKRLIIEKTEGTPFFMEETVQVLLDEGSLVRNGAVKITKPLAELKIPPTVQSILASRIDRLPSDAKDMLQALAVIGREFPLSLVHAVVTKSDDEISRTLNDLQLSEFIYEQPAIGEAEYVFKHSLTQEVAYNSVLTKRRKLLHERAGQALESMFGANLEDHLSELAHHYSRSENLAKAVEYLGRAGQQALRRSAYVDAIGSLSQAIELLQRLPESPERIQQELGLQLAVGPALFAVKGFASPEAQRVYARARALCGLRDDPPELFPALYGLWCVYLVRAENRAAYEIGEELSRLAQSTRDPAVSLYARVALGMTSYQMGEFPCAKEHLEIGSSLYDRERHHTLVFRYGGTDAGVLCRSVGAFALWCLGRPDQALQRTTEAVALAQELSDPQSLAAARYFKGLLHQLRQETPVAQEIAESVIALSTEHGFAFWLAQATILRGWAIAEQGRNEEGIAQIRQGLATARSTGAEWERTSSLRWLAEACGEINRVDEGLSALAESFAVADQHQERTTDAEAYRLTGELLLKRDHSNATEAQVCFERAIEMARKQSAKSWELRATMSLARLFVLQGRRDEARAMLAEIYGWFTEGFDAADLIDAKALLDELGT